jgi:ribosomal protein S21
MATNVEVVRNPNENSLSILRRFTKRVQGAGVLPRVRGIRYNERVLSHYKRKMKTLEIIDKKAALEKLAKLGKLPVKEKRGR